MPELKKTENVKSKIIFFLASAILISFVLSHQLSALVSRQNNTILNNENWFSEKINLSAGVVGAVAYISTRVSLAQDRLQLGAWHGYNMVTTYRNFVPKYAEFTTKVSANGNISFIFDKNSEGYKAVRLSTNDLIDSEFVEVDSLGFFKKHEKINYKIPANETVRVSIRFHDKNLVVAVSEHTVAEIQIREVKAGAVGFKSEAGETWVDNVFIEDVSTEKFSDDFTFKYFSLYRLAFFFIIFGSFLIWDAKFWNNINFLFVARVAVAIFIFPVAALNWVDLTKFSSFYKNQPSLIEILSQASKLRGIKNTISGVDEVRSKLANQEPDLRNKFQIVLLGSSQTWGAGAASEEFRLENIVEKRLKIKLKNSDLKVINLAVSGFRAHDMVDALSWSNALNPKYVIINLGNNDVAGESVRPQLLRLIEMSHKVGFKLYFVKEANYFLDRNTHLSDIHAVISEVAIKNKITVINGDQALEQNSRSGFLWWDNVHLSSAGQKILADAIVDEIQ